jgi:hypothetical protein
VLTRGWAGGWHGAEQGRVATGARRRVVRVATRAARATEPVSKELGAFDLAEQWVCADAAGRLVCDGTAFGDPVRAQCACAVVCGEVCVERIAVEVELVVVSAHDQPDCGIMPGFR